jgi:hypothetical protein
MMKTTIRCISTRTSVDKWFNALQSSSQDERQIKLGQFMKTALQKNETVHPNFVNDIIYRWTTEQPTTDALWTSNANTNDCQKLTYNDIYVQSSRLANVLTGKQFNLTAGKSVCYDIDIYYREIYISEIGSCYITK